MISKTLPLIMLFAAAGMAGGLAQADERRYEERSYVTEIPKILAASPASDWQLISDDDLLFLDLAKGTVVLELAPFAAPAQVAQIKALIRSGYFKNSAILRVQENYVVQWGDPTSEQSLGNISSDLPDERRFALSPHDAVTPLDARDSYAPQTAFLNSFPIGISDDGKQAWILHCHSSVGAVQDSPDKKPRGTYLYAVIGHPPRGLDGSLAVVGRIIDRIDLLSTMARGGGAYGFLDEKDYIPIARTRLGSDIPSAERPQFEKLRSNSDTFARMMVARRTRGAHSAATTAAPIDACAIPLLIRPIPPR